MADGNNHQKEFRIAGNSFQRHLVCMVNLDSSLSSINRSFYVLKNEQSTGRMQ